MWSAWISLKRYTNLQNPILSLNLLIVQKLGVLDLLDEESRFPKGTDQSLLEKLHNAHKANAFYVKPKVNNAKFGIRHYAGEVFYDVNGLLEKNRDTFRDDVLKVLKESR